MWGLFYCGSEMWVSRGRQYKDECPLSTIFHSLPTSTLMLQAESSAARFVSFHGTKRHGIPENGVCRILEGSKVKESRNRPGVAQSVPGGLGSQISWHSAHEVMRLSASRFGRLYPQEMFLVPIFTRDWVEPRTWYSQKEYVTEKSSDTTGNRTRDRPSSSAAS
jgi:hypothetical protein